MDDSRCDIGAYESPGVAPERPGHIAGRPLDVYANGVGNVQIRDNDAPYGAFADDESLASAGLAFLVGGVYYPAGGPAVTDEPGQRAPVSGPVARITGSGGRALESVYY